MISSSNLMPELRFTTSRSSGPGGQNVNKVESKVTLTFNVSQSRILNEQQKELIRAKLHSRITNDGILIISSQENRSQLQNKEIVLQKLDELMVRAFTKVKKRKKSKPSKTAVQKRLKSKKLLSEKKKWRQKF